VPGVCGAHLTGGVIANAPATDTVTATKTPVNSDNFFIDILSDDILGQEIAASQPGYAYYNTCFESMAIGWAERPAARLRGRRCGYSRQSLPRPYLKLL